MKNIFKSIHRKWNLFRVNKIYKGTKHFEKKRKLLNAIGFKIGKGTKIVAPIECCGGLTIGENCWIGKNLVINGNGQVIIGNNCDIAPEVTFQTGGHIIGEEDHRAGAGFNCIQIVEDGVWIGGRSTIIGNTRIKHGSVVAGCACVVKDVEQNSLVGGVPAKLIKELN